MNHAIISIVQYLIDVAYAHLVNYSIIVITYRALVLHARGLIGPTK